MKCAQGDFVSTIHWRKGTQDGKIPAAYSWEDPSLFFLDFLPTAGRKFLVLIRTWQNRFESCLSKGISFCFQEEFILQWQEDAVACPAKFIWKGSFAMNQRIFFSYHRQKSLFQKQTEVFSLFCTPATLLTSVPKLTSQALWISGQKEKKSELQHSKVHIFRADQQIKDQNSACKFRRDKCVNLPSCPVGHHLVDLNVSEIIGS